MSIPSIKYFPSLLIRSNPLSIRKENEMENLLKDLEIISCRDVANKSRKEKRTQEILKVFVGKAWELSTKL